MTSEPQKLLIDTNCWMQILRDREHAQVVRDLLNRVEAQYLAMTDFGLHGLFILGHRYKMTAELPRFMKTIGMGSRIAVLRLTASEILSVASASLAYTLDIDDAYQYAAAELFGYRIVSFDADFDRTPRGRLTPDAALALYPPRK